MQKLVIAMVAFGVFAFGQGKAAPKDKFLPIVFLTIGGTLIM